MGRKRAAENGKRYTSEARLLGWPVVAIAMGPDPETGNERGVAKGWIAVGDVAVGGIAVGGASVGFVAVGGLGVGVVGVGGLGLGLIGALGGGAVGGLACGGGAIGGFAVGGGAIGYAASGAGAVGVYARGVDPSGTHTISQQEADPAAVAFFTRHEWFFGVGAGSSTQAVPVSLFGTGGGMILGIAVVLAVLVFLLTRLGGAKRDVHQRGVSDDGRHVR